MDNSVLLESINKYKGNTYCIILGNGDTIYLNSSVISEYSLKAGMNIPQSALDSIIYADTLRKAKERAFYLLEYRDHSYKELYDKLKRNYPDEICTEVLEKMTDLGFIDDEKYARMFARQLFEIKGYGSYRVKHEMQRKGIDNDIIEQCLKSYGDDTQNRLEELILRKYCNKLSDANSVRKVYNALLRQGYSYSDIKAVLKKYIDEVEY